MINIYLKIITLLLLPSPFLSLSVDLKKGTDAIFLTECDLELYKIQEVNFSNYYGYKTLNKKDTKSLFNAFIKKKNGYDKNKRCDFFISFDYGENSESLKRYAKNSNNKIYYQIKDFNGFPIEKWDLNLKDKTKVLLKGEVPKGKTTSIFPFKVSLPKEQDNSNGVYKDKINATLYSGYGEYSNKLNSLPMNIRIEVLNINDTKLDSEEITNKNITFEENNIDKRLSSETPFYFISNSFSDIVIKSLNKGVLVNKNNHSNGIPYSFSINNKEYSLKEPLTLKNISPHEKVDINTKIYSKEPILINNQFEDIIEFNIISQ